MSRFGLDAQGSIKRRSGWIVPLVVFFATACLSALVLAFYFGPAGPSLVDEQPAPTDATRPIELSVGTDRFRIPANYIVLASERRGGSMTKVAMIAILPDLQGYTLGAAPDFTGNSPDSRVVNLLLKSGQTVLPDGQRLDRVYLAQVENADGQQGPYGLRQYAFRAESGYHEQDLFVGNGDAGPLVLLCTKLSPDTVSPSCMRDFPLSQTLSVSYRFRRAHLAQWRAIDSGVHALIGKFAGKG